jgi:Uma2 family endonuclease
MAVPIPKLTPDEYLKIERQADFKSEYYRGEMFAMAGGSPKHSARAANLIGLLFNRLRGKGCQIFTSDLRVRTGANGLYTYPDISVVCGKPMYATDEGDVLINPKVIFEVLSPSTEGKDRGFKFQQYKQIESLQEYVLVSQTEPLVERFGRALGGAWTGYSEARGVDATLTLESLGIEIALAEIYQDIEFDS